MGKSGWWLTYPSEKYDNSSVGMMIIQNIWKVVKFMFQTTNQNISQLASGFALPIHAVTVGQLYGNKACSFQDGFQLLQIDWGFLKWISKTILKLSCMTWMISRYPMTYEPPQSTKIMVPWTCNHIGQAWLQDGPPQWCLLVFKPWNNPHECYSY